jgi:hypothetical protein
MTDRYPLVLNGTTVQELQTGDGILAPVINGAVPYHVSDIINGQFRIAQAGISFAAPANLAYDLDGWQWSNSFTTAVATVAQVAGSTAGKFARQVTITTAASATVGVNDLVRDITKIEGYNIVKYVGNTFIVGFRAKVPVAGIHCVVLISGGTDNSYVHEINFPAANVMQDCSFIVVGGLPTAGNWNYTNGVGLILGFLHVAGTTRQTATVDAWTGGLYFATANQVNDCVTIGNVWALEDFRMNPGTVLIDYEISYDDDLRHCQRYYPILTPGTNGPIGVAATPTIIAGKLILPLPVPTRVAPTGITLSGTAPQVGYGVYTSLTFTAASLLALRLSLAGTGFLLSGATEVFGAADGTTKMAVDGCRL